MLKKFSEFIKESPEEPKARKEKEFKDLHTDNTEKKDYPTSPEAAFKGKTYRAKRRADKPDSDPKQK